MPMNKKIIAENIKRQRKEKMMSQARLAELADLSTQYISHVETCKKTISLGAAYRVADALNVSIGAILDNNISSSKPENNEIDYIFSDCNMYERQILIEVLSSTKNALRENKELLYYIIGLEGGYK